MIQVEVKKNNNLVNEVIIKGHAMYAPIGEDIVCSAVSSIVITTVNGILALDKDTLTHEYKKDVLTIKILKKDEISQTLLKNMLNLLHELESSYKDNIVIK